MWEVLLNICPITVIIISLVLLLQRGLEEILVAPSLPLLLLLDSLPIVCVPLGLDYLALLATNSSYSLVQSFV